MFLFSMIFIYLTTVAVRRCYENLRHIYTEQQTGKEDYVERQSKSRKYRSRRERVCMSIYYEYLL